MSAFFRRMPGLYKTPLVSVIIGNILCVCLQIDPFRGWILAVVTNYCFDHWPVIITNSQIKRSSYWLRLPKRTTWQAVILSFILGLKMYSKELSIFWDKNYKVWFDEFLCIHPNQTVHSYHVPRTSKRLIVDPTIVRNVSCQ